MYSDIVNVTVQGQCHEIFDTFLNRKKLYLSPYEQTERFREIDYTDTTMTTLTRQ